MFSTKTCSSISSHWWAILNKNDTYCLCDRLRCQGEGLAARHQGGPHRQLHQLELRGHGPLCKHSASSAQARTQIEDPLQRDARVRASARHHRERRHCKSEYCFSLCLKWMCRLMLEMRAGTMVHSSWPDSKMNTTCLTINGFNFKDL